MLPPLPLLPLCLLLAVLAWQPTTESASKSPLLEATRVDSQHVGQVAQALRAKRYTYLRLQESPKDTWHVIMGRAPRVGQSVRLRGYAQLQGYRSPSLNQRFERLIFSSLQTP